MEWTKSIGSVNQRCRQVSVRRCAFAIPCVIKMRLWADFLAMGLTAVDSLSKSVSVLCEGRLEVVHEVKSLERDSDSADVRIEQECLRILALFEPVASDLRRLATILKVSRDWERIADLAARVAQRSRKLAKKPESVPVPEQLKALARDVLAHVCAAYDALVSRDAVRARAVIQGDRSIDRQYRQLRDQLKESLRQNAGQLESWLQLMSNGRNLERHRRPCDRHRAGRRLFTRREHHPPQNRIAGGR